MSRRRQVALLSVFRKPGIVEFAQELRALNYRILASGGTAKTLKEAGIPVTDVASLTGRKAILNHKVVTLSGEVHAGLLADYITEVEEMAQLDLPFINLVCVDLYPLEAEIAREGSTRESVIKLTDIGGPTMLRSAAKGRRIIVSDPSDRDLVLNWLKAEMPDEDSFRTMLVAKAETTVSKYCLASATYHSGGAVQGLIGTKVAECCYGENRAQSPAALYSTGSDDPLGLDKFKQIGGSAPSYNNFCDIDRLLATMTSAAAVFDRRSLESSIALAGKHGNPCGAAYGQDATTVIGNMVDGDHLAIFGGSVMTNFPITADLAEHLMKHGMQGESRRMLDCIIAPDITEGALGLMRRKGDKCRFFINPTLMATGLSSVSNEPVIRPVRGGFLIQPSYQVIPEINTPEFYWSGRRLTQEEELDLLFAWAIGSTSNSNTVTLVRDSMLVGNGVGQQARVYGCRLAVERAGQRAQSAVAYSDSFFPEVDGPEVLALAGIKAILTSSGSIRDNDVIEYCRRIGTTLVMGPDSLIRGFYRH